jgi:hypothetical protein
MRTILSTAAVLLMAAVAPAAAEDLTGTYDVKYEEVSTNCPSPLKYQHGKLEVKKTSTGVNVDIDRTPLMQGSLTKVGKVSAKSKSGPTMLDGMKGVFSVAGRITPEGVLTFVMVGEYTAGGKALCSQSWNVVGSRAEATPTPTPPKKKSTSTEQMFVPSILR